MNLNLEQIQEWVHTCNKEKENEVIFQKEMETKLSDLRVSVCVIIESITHCNCGQEQHGSALEEMRREQATQLAK